MVTLQLAPGLDTSRNWREWSRGTTTVAPTFSDEGRIERAEREATEKGHYDLERRFEGAACREFCLWTVGLVSQAKNKPVDGRPRRSPAHSDLLPQPAPWPLPLTAGVRLGHHHLLFPGPSPGRGASTFPPLLDDASPLGLGADFPTESCRDAGQLQVCTRRRAASEGCVMF